MSLAARVLMTRTQQRSPTASGRHKLPSANWCQVQVGLELGAELLVRALVGVQIDDLLREDDAWQRRRPAVESGLPARFRTLAT
jgi:hypothetical protein